MTRRQVQQLLAGREDSSLGPYRLLEQVGAGGMAVVFKALHLDIRRLFAVKTLCPELSRRPEAIAFFQREVAAAVTVHHPHVVRSFGSKCFDGTHFLIMEYVEGCSLRQWMIQGGKLPIEWACEIIRQAALGLAHIHERGLIHRDIKPGNLMVAADRVGASPRVKIVDFGIARSLGRGSAVRETTPPHFEPTFRGTPNFAAPEQVSGAECVDQRSDIFSLGCTLFQVLCNELPFHGATMPERLAARLRLDAPRVRSLRPDVPRALDRVVATMLARQPHWRYADATEVAAELTPFSMARVKRHYREARLIAHSTAIRALRHTPRRWARAAAVFCGAAYGSP